MVLYLLGIKFGTMNFLNLPCSLKKIAQKFLNQVSNQGWKKQEKSG